MSTVQLDNMPNAALLTKARNPGSSNSFSFTPNYNPNRTEKQGQKFSKQKPSIANLKYPNPNPNPYQKTKTLPETRELFRLSQTSFFFFDNLLGFFFSNQTLTPGKGREMWSVSYFPLKNQT